MNPTSVLHDCKTTNVLLLGEHRSLKGIYTVAKKTLVPKFGDNFVKS